MPRIRDGEVLVRVDTCGVCATDLKKVEFGLLPPPRIFGHETAGVIAALGRGVRGWRIGDRVAVFHHIPCGLCFYCKRRDYAQCAVYKRTGTTAGFEPAGGGFAQYVCVLPWIVKHGMVRVPRGVLLEEASFIEPVNTCLKAVDRLGLRPEDWVLVFGQGPIGLMFTQIVKARVARAVGIDLIHRRLRLARRLGAVLVEDPLTALFESHLRCATDGRGADAAILAVPSESAFQQAIHLVRKGGVVNLFGGCPAGSRVTLDTHRMHYDEITLKSSFHHKPSSVRIALDAIAKGVVQPRQFISDEKPLEELPALLHEMLRSKKVVKTCILPHLS
ncbi:MAG: alcohol dehydrogenase catalytic domain-containing protein [Verrucomicrobia bacterium]|nr:alcohol dehydrogenase catalytic domain-containing protein [Verrucomicrobiota bacterium]